MALVRGTGNPNYRRYHWMGADKSESSFENTALMRDQGDTARSKHRNREQRTRVVREVRCYLDHIRKEIIKNDEDAELLGMAKSGYKREETEIVENEKASMNLSCLVRGARYRSGEGLSSFFDGTSHSTSDLPKYNAYCRQTLTDLIEEKKKTLGEKRDRGEVLSNRESIALEEANVMELPTEEETEIDPNDLAVLEKPEGEALEEKKLVSEQYNEKALQWAKNLLRYNLVRNANLYASYREQALSGANSTIIQEDQEDTAERQALTTPPAEEDPAPAEEEKKQEDPPELQETQKPAEGEEDPDEEEEGGQNAKPDPDGEAQPDEQPQKEMSAEEAAAEGVA